MESKKQFNSRKSYALPVKKELQEQYNIETLKNFVEKEQKFTKNSKTIEKNI